MSQNVLRARLVGIWCMSVMTIGASSIVVGAALTMVNGGLLFTACVVPPLIMLLVWRHAASIALATVAGALAVVVAMPPVSAQSLSRYREFELGGSLPSISALTGVAESEAKTIQSRPALMQELRWQRPYSTPSDAVQQTRVLQEKARLVNKAAFRP